MVHTRSWEFRPVPPSTFEQEEIIMNQSNNLQMQEVLAFLGQRNFFGSPYIDREKFKVRVKDSIYNILAQDKDKLSDPDNLTFALTYNKLGFSKRMDVVISLHVNPVDQKATITLIKANMGKINQLFILNRSAVPTLKEIETALHNDHKKEVQASAIRRKPPGNPR